MIGSSLRSRPAIMSCRKELIQNKSSRHQIVNRIEVIGGKSVSRMLHTRIGVRDKPSRLIAGMTSARHEICKALQLHDVNNMKEAK